MAPASKQLVSLAIALVSIGASNAQRSETVWGSIVVSTFGDRVPLLSPDYSVLTPLGAQQMYDAGQFFRTRYMDMEQDFYNIEGLSTSQLDMTQTFTFSLSDVFVQQSAQAFMAGLYPPTGLLGFSNSTLSNLANNSTVNGPLNGTQYANILSFDLTSPSRVYFDGITNCPAYTAEVQRNYTSTPAFMAEQSTTAPFYNSLDESAFSTALSNSNVSFANAYDVWDFLNYEVVHNATVAHSLPPSVLNTARYYADQYAAATVGNAMNNSLLTVAGQTLATQILYLMAANADQEGAQAKLSLLFTSWEPLMSFAALLGLPSVNSTFLGMPNVGSSMAIEMYSVTEGNTTAVPAYPDSQDMYVRVMWRNTTGLMDTTTGLTSYPMPAVPNPSNGGVPFTDFFSTLETFAMDVSNWCNACGSSSSFCPYFDPADWRFGNGGNNGGHGQVTPVVAGVIGAAVTMAVCGLILIASMLLLGVRFRRDGAGGASSTGGPRGIMIHKRRKSDMGGFKGTKKLASDVDLPKSGAAVGASVAPVHNRTNSWEMKQGGAGLLRPKHESQMTAVGEEDDPAADFKVTEASGIRLHRDDEEEALENMKAVETRESV